MGKPNEIYTKLSKLRPKALTKFEHHHSTGKELFRRNCDAIIHTLDQKEADYKKHMEDTAKHAEQCIERAVVSALRAKLSRHEILASKSSLVLNRTNKFYHSVMGRIARDVRLGVTVTEEDLISMLPPELVGHLQESIAGFNTDGILDPVLEEVERRGD